MTREEIDKYAFKDKRLPKDADSSDKLYWLIVCNVYKYLKNKEMNREEKTAYKKAVVAELDNALERAMPDKNIIECFNRSVEAEKELCKLISPRSKLAEKSKEELLEIILKFQGILSGLMENADDEIPEFLKIKNNS